MKGFLSSLFLCVLVVAFVATTASANPSPPPWASTVNWNWCPDPIDSSPSGGSDFEIYGIGVAWDETTIYVNVRTNFDINSFHGGGDSYTGNNGFLAGDLYLNVGGTFQSRSGDVYGVATKTHGNEVMQAYQNWGGNVTAGHLYDITPSHENGTLHDGTGPGGVGDTGAATDDAWASGTYEGYNTASPPDGSPAGLNDYPTLIRYSGTDLGMQSVAQSGPNGGKPLFDLWYTVDRASIGLTCGNADSLQVFWAMECGNDGAEWNGDIPEPTTVVLIGAGLVAMAHRKRSTHV